MTIDPAFLDYLSAALADPRPGRRFTGDYEAEIAFLRSSPRLPLSDDDDQDDR